MDRRTKNAEGRRESDFVNCVAWRGQADFLHQYFQKGRKIGIEGQIQSSTYTDKNGQRQYQTQVLIDQIDFVDSAPKQQQPQEAPAQFTPADDGEPLPF